MYCWQKIFLKRHTVSEKKIKNRSSQFHQKKDNLNFSLFSTRLQNEKELSLMGNAEVKSVKKHYEFKNKKILYCDVYHNYLI